MGDAEQPNHKVTAAPEHGAAAAIGASDVSMRWCEQLDSMLAEVWTRLARGVADRRAATRHPTLATVGLDGGAEARTVVLRQADRTAGEVHVYTDAASAKVAQIRASTKVTLHVWDARARLQIRLRGDMDILNGAVAQAVWDRLSDEHRSNYGGTAQPGAVIEHPEDIAAAPDPQRLTVLRCVICDIETLHLGTQPHQRAIFRREDGWQGAWLAP